MPIRLLAPVLCFLAVPLLGAGERMMPNARTFLAGLPNNVRLLGTGDFNGDGHMDLFASGSSPGDAGDELRVYPGDGAGLFGLPILTQPLPYEVVALADFNGDGRQDALLRSYDHLSFGVMLGQGNGTFGSSTATATLGSAEAVLAGDFNGDGRLDVLTHEQAQNSARAVLYPGNSSGGFDAAIPSALIAGSAYAGGVSGDFDGDGRLDAAFGNGGTRVFFNNGDGTFSKGAAALDGDALTAADLDADGISDLVTGYEGTSTPARIYRGRADRALTGQELGTTAGRDAAVLDLTGDGKPDIVIASRSGTFFVVSSQPGGTFSAPRLFAPGLSTVKMAVADFDGDGKADVITAGGRASFSLSGGNGDGTFRVTRGYETPLDLTGTDLALLDMNGDSLPDIMTSTPGSWQLATQFALPGGGFAPPVRTLVPYAPHDWMEAYPVPDVDGDGRPDTILQRATLNASTITFILMHGNANGTFSQGYSWQAGSTVTAVLDVTGDGKIDVVADKIYAGDGIGAFGPGGELVDYSHGLPYFADLNHDGRIDQLTSTGSLFLARLANADGTFTAVQSPGTLIDTVADVNGDNFPDVIRGTTVYPGRGDGTFGPALVSIFADQPAEELRARGDAVTVRTRGRVFDVDGDGKVDLISQGTVFYGTGTGYFDASASFPGWLADAFPADVDHDGKQELVGYGNTYLLFFQPATKPIGAFASAITIADFWPQQPRYGDVVSFNATVTAPTRVMPTGSFRWRAGSRELGIMRVDNAGRASLGVQLNAGTTTVTVEYVGDDQLAPQSTTADVTVGKASASTGITSSKSLYSIGEPIVLNATVSLPPLVFTPAPTGNVTFKKGTTVLGTKPIGQALTITDPALFSLGTHTLTAEYEGNANYVASVSPPLTITVQKATPAMTLQLPPTPVLARRLVTFTALFPAGVTGSVAFFVNGAAIGTVAIANDAASINYTFDTNGFPPVRAEYSGDANDNPVTVTKNVSVYYGDLTDVPKLKLSLNRLPNGDFNPTVSTSPVFGATHYDFYRAKDGGPLTLWSSNTLGGAGEAMPANEARYYAVVARDDAGNVSPRSNIVIALGMAFTDEPLVGGGTDVKAAHINELQLGINAIRLAAGLPPAPFTTVAPGTIIRAAELAALHDALAQARTAIGMTTTYNDAVIGPMTVVRALHVQELRNQTR